MSAPESFELATHSVAPGERARFQVPVARLPTDTWVSLPVEVVHGATAGPRLWLAAAVHGDELNGVEIIHRVLSRIDAPTLVGTVVAVPIVNVFGFIHQLRYLPDRRDLNRCFPGSRSGSLASRLAHLIMTEVVERCTHGIDLHTGSHHRANLPQIRADLDDAHTRELALAFGAPVVIHARTPDGSLRGAAAQLGKPVLLFEGGEALRFDEASITTGVTGVLRCMAALGMSPASLPPPKGAPTAIYKTRWLRARRGGILRMVSALGERVEKGQSLGTISDAFGSDAAHVRAPAQGVVLGLNKNPLVNQGDALIHLGVLTDSDEPSGGASQPSAAPPQT